jgi:hypothetical protein
MIGIIGGCLIFIIYTYAEGEYGVLTDDLKKIAAQLTRGVPFEDALRILAYPTPMIKRSVELIIERYMTGGEVGKVLKIGADDAMELKALEKRRLAYMGHYTINSLLRHLLCVHGHLIGALSLVHSNDGRIHGEGGGSRRSGRCADFRSECSCDEDAFLPLCNLCGFEEVSLTVC